MNRLVILIVAFGCLLGSARLPGQNLIVNGDFDAGDSGFTSGYTFVASGTSRIPGTFGTRASSSDFNPSYTAFTDHTGNGGLMMLMDGSTVAGTTVWQETVPVNAGLNYTFSAWTTSFSSTNPARLRFLIDAVPVGPDLDVTSVSGNWQNFTAVWNAGSNTSATISIVDTMVQDGGNNFALDDLSLVTTSGTVQFASAAANTTENAGSVALTVQRTGGSVGAITVDYATSDGTALAGTDYTATSGTLTWADGDATDKTVTVPLTDRSLYDGSTKTFTVTLANATGGAALGTILAASVSILDNDVPPQPTITLASPPASLTVVAGADLPLAATVADPGGILAFVQFALDGAPVGPALTTAPFVFDTTVPAAPGDHAVTASVIDTQGRANTSSLATLTVVAPTAAAPPTTSVLSSIAGRDLAAGSSVTVCATAAADPSTSLNQLSFYADGVLLQTFSAVAAAPSAGPSGQGVTRRDAPVIAPISFAKGTSFPQPPGEDKLVNLVTVALDQLGHSTVSKVATFHSKVADHPAPVVAVTGATGTSHFQVGTTTTISVDAHAGTATGLAWPQAGPGRADAASEAQLAELEYFINGVSLGKATQPPFSFDFTPPSAGKYVFISVATDASGLAAVSAPVTVVADPVPPTVNLAAGGSGIAVEGGAAGIVLVTRTGGDTSAALTVDYKVKGTAVAGVDYKRLPGTITIPAGAARAKIKVKPLAGSHDAGVLKLKFVLLPSIDGSYVVGTSPAKIKLVGK